MWSSRRKFQDSPRHVGVFVSVCKAEGEPHQLYLWAKVTMENADVHPPNSSETVPHATPPANECASI